MINEDRIREELVKDIIDAIFDKAEELNFAWHYGEESLLVTDIVNIINNVAKTDYKRYGCGFLKEDWRPHCRDRKCYKCSDFFAHYYKKEHRNHCIGCNDASKCEEFKAREF